MAYTIEHVVPRRTTHGHVYQLSSDGAGAHRAGTTGTAWVMYASKLPSETAIQACKACRPVVDPFGDLAKLLKKLEIAQAELRWFKEG